MQMSGAVCNRIAHVLQTEALGRFDGRFARNVLKAYSFVSGKHPHKTTSQLQALTTDFLDCQDDEVEGEVRAVLEAASTVHAQIAQEIQSKAAHRVRSPVRHRTLKAVPRLSYSKPIYFTFGGVPVSLSWRAGLVVAIRHAIANGRNDLITIPWWNVGMRAPYSGFSVCTVDGLDICFQDQGADRAWRTIEHIALGLGMDVKLIVRWTHGDRRGRDLSFWVDGSRVRSRRVQ